MTGSGPENVIVIGESESSTSSSVDVDSKNDDDDDDEIQEGEKKIALVVDGGGDGDSLFDPEKNLQQTHKFNLDGVTPVSGFRLEILDADFIWSSASIIDAHPLPDAVTSSFSKARHSHVVVVRYDGWESAWDETLKWPNDRIARLYTHTLSTVALVDLRTKRGGGKRPAAGFWPCEVMIRMPHSGSQKGRDALATENRIFVKPIHPTTLPLKPADAKIVNPPRWVPVRCIRCWRQRSDAIVASCLGDSSWCEAHAAAVAALATTGKRPHPSSRAFVQNTLLAEAYRIDIMNLAKTPLEKISAEAKVWDGKSVTKKRPWEESVTGKEKKKKKNCRGEGEKLRESRLTRMAAASLRKPPPPPPPPPPLLPAPVHIHTSSLSHNVVRLGASKAWGVTTNLGGNDLLVGSFPTQRRAALVESVVSKNRRNYDAGQKQNRKMVLPSILGEQVGDDEGADDVKSVDVETAIAVVRAAAGDGSGVFMIAKWMEEYGPYHDYHVKKKTVKGELEERLSERSEEDSRRSGAVVCKTWEQKLRLGKRKGVLPPRRILQPSVRPMSRDLDSNNLRK